MRIGILGGTFNPVHNGHISIASKIYKHFSLDKVMFMPNKIPPHKNSDRILDEDVRVDMLSRAIGRYHQFSIEDYELNKNSVSYTYESLEYFKKIYNDSKLFFIIGSDSFLDFGKWKNVDRIFKSATIIVYLRDYLHKDSVFKLREYYTKLYNVNIEIFLGDIIEVSSTDIRRKIMYKEDIRNLVPKEVYDYIIFKKLYME